MLEKQGLVRSIPRRGCFVPSFDREDMLEIFDIRFMLESKIYKILIDEKKLSDEDFSILKDMIDQMVRNVDNADDMQTKLVKMTEMDLKFHSYLWEKSGRKWSYQLLSNIYFQLRLAMMQDTMLEDNLSESAAMHYKIIQALKEGNLEKAKSQLIDHILTMHNLTYECDVL